MSECVGLTWVDLQVIAITIATDFGLTAEDAELVIRCMIEGGLILRCRNHPGRYMALKTSERLHEWGCDEE